MIPALELTQSTPAITSGGIMDGRDIARMLENGASAIQLGAAFLACPESGASAAYKQALLAAKEDTTVITRAFAAGRRAAWRMSSPRSRKGARTRFYLSRGRTRSLAPCARPPPNRGSRAFSRSGPDKAWGAAGPYLPASWWRLMEETDRAGARQMP